MKNNYKLLASQIRTESRSLLALLCYNVREECAFPAAALESILCVLAYSIYTCGRRPSTSGPFSRPMFSHSVSILLHVRLSHSPSLQRKRRSWCNQIAIIMREEL